FTAISPNGAPLIPNPGMVMEPCDPPSSPFAARSTMTSNGRPGICTVPSHRPAAFSSAREMNADARSKINATRMRSPLHALCPRCEEVVNRCFPRSYAITVAGYIDFSFPPLGCAHSIPGKNHEMMAICFLILTFLAVATTKRLRQFRRQQRRCAIMRRDICAEATCVFQNPPTIHSAREPNHQSRHESIARADRVLHFDVWRGRSC